MAKAVFKSNFSFRKLSNALEKALEVKKRRLMRKMPNMDIAIPEQKRDITLMIKQSYRNILNFLMEAKGKLTFTQLTNDSEGTSPPLIRSSNCFFFSCLKIFCSKSNAVIFFSSKNFSYSTLENLPSL